MLRRFIVFLTDATSPKRHVCTTRLVYARRRYGALRLARIAARDIFDNQHYGTNIFVNVWSFDDVEEQFINDNVEFLSGRTHLSAGNTITGIADQTDDLESFQEQAMLWKHCLATSVERTCQILGWR